MIDMFQNIRMKHFIFIVLLIQTCFSFKAYLDKAHERITQEGCKRAGYPYTSTLETGIIWPDAPCEDFDKIKYCLIEPIYGKLATCTLAWRSDYGDLSHW